jgi:hypothetical protein
VYPLHAASLTIGLAFLSACMLAAPFCASACKAIPPSTSIAAVNVIMSLLMALNSWFGLPYLSER